MPSIEEFLEEVRRAARESGIVKSEELMYFLYPKAKMRFHLIDGSFIDIYFNVKRDLQYYHWQRIDGKIYRVNNHPLEGWHEHVDVEERKRPFRKITPYEFFAKVKEKLT